MKKFLSCAAAGALLSASSACADTVPVTQVAVVVNDSVITSGEVEAKLAEYAGELSKKYGNNRSALQQERIKLTDRIFEEKIEDKMIIHEFVTSPYATNILEAFIDDRIQERIQHDYYGDRSRLIQTLHAEGKTYEMFRREQREKFIIEYMNFQNDSNVRKIIISPLKIETYYNAHQAEYKIDDQVKVRMIVLPQSADHPGAGKELGQEILTEIDSGVPFAEMAAVNSSDSHRTDGGDRGWVDRKLFRKEVSDVAFSLAAGQHSGVIETPEACYIVEVEDTKPAHVKQLEEVRGDIERALKNEESLRLRKLWIDRLKRKSFYRFY